ncbi:ABC transporter ATP-binding protein [Glaciihabitans arcticus]|uniref:ABC transporter ATP-binding protein n=1 Tax=Glaciihabitans arcticus TaxID=2668039 RepID=A0A4Q9GQW4_9MICO|nr:ABC transporter ATP-binding protein [Glaciihabitans arcticus]TBN57272.1 ABC transporter ATP-binding protein [Glaciihabitans arcticus]
MTNATSTAGPVVEAAALSYNYGDRGEFQAVRSLDLRVERGELYALLGTNGAGKTTTLETLEGHRTPTSGKVSVFGGDPRDRASIRPRVGIMLQDSGFAGDLTVAESIGLAGSISGREDDVRRVLGVVDLTAKSSTRAGMLSGGEKRRLDFAMAIWGTPELVFLDEPTTGLDPSARDGLWDAVAEIRSAGSTIILTTHYLEEAQKYADRIGLMNKGVLEREGTLEELVTGHPSHITLVAPHGVDLPLTVTATENGLSRIDTADLQADLSTLLAWASAGGHTLDRLGATSSSLDDVFRTLDRS